MIYYKDIKDNVIRGFACRQENKNYILASQDEIDNFLLSDRKRKLIADRKFYLSSTDWYIQREYDEAGTYPQEIKDKRILARAEINEIEACESLDYLELTEF